jgi:hypothetical protein
MTANQSQNSPIQPNGVRIPNPEELQQIGEWLSEHSLGEVFPDWANSAWIAVFDNYITDCPGYAGKVIVVVWGAGPDTMSVFTEEKGVLVLSSNHDDTCGSNDHE